MSTRAPSLIAQGSMGEVLPIAFIIIGGPGSYTRDPRSNLRLCFYLRRLVWGAGLMSPRVWLGAVQGLESCSPAPQRLRPVSCHVLLCLGYKAGPPHIQSQRKPPYSMTGGTRVLIGPSQTPSLPRPIVSRPLKIPHLL